MTPRSHTLTSRVSLLGAGLGVAALAAFVPISAASAAVSQGAGCTGSAGTVTCEFYAVNGTVAVPGSATPMPVMGYSDSATGAPILPGPSIVATVGDVVTVKLHNALTAPAQPTGLLFQEQAMAPDTTGIAAGNPTASITYTFTPTAAGTYLYEASPFVKTTGGGGSQYQAAMGMSGALVVRPASAGQAYADPGTAYDTEHLVVVSELDRALTASNAATFDMRNYAPDYYLINGKASPQTADLPAAAGQKVLLRYVNAGIKAHSMGLLGLEEQKVVGEDGNALDNPRRMVAETLGAGQTDDVIVDLPADASGKYPVYDAGMAMNNNGAAGMGGMLTFLSVGAPAGGLPATSNVRVVGTDLLADVSGGATQARYFVDQITGAGTDMGTPSGGTFTASISTHPGSHTFYVQGSADGVTWGPVSSVIYTSADTTGPTTKSLNLSPNPSNGSAAVLLKATGDDSASGGSDITAGHYTIDGPVLSPTDLNGLTTTNMTPNAAAPVAALDTTIPASTVAGLSEGDHTVRVYSRDSAGNWGAATPIMITRDTTGPAGSSPTALPNPNNGTNAFSTSVQAVRVTGSFTDAPSGIAAGEGFIDSAGATGTGFPLVPTDGTFGSPTEILRADIPLATIKALAQGNHAILLRGKDGAGNWGATISTPLVIDKTGPGVTALTAADVPGNFTSVTLTATAADPGATSPVNRAEWFSGTDPGVGNGSPVTVSGAGPNYSLSTTIDFATQGWAFAPRTISVRARDALGNWGAPVSITVSPDLIFANAFASGNASAWSGTTNGGGGRITFPGGTANMPSSATGSAMQVALAGSASYLTDNSPVAEPTYHGRFYFNPNASSPGNSPAGIGIFAGYTANNGGGTTRFVVRYRLSGAQRQVALEVACTTITAQPACTGGVRTTPFVTVSTATPIEVAWTAGASTTASLTVGATTMSLTPLNTGAANRIESVRLGEVLNPAGTGNPRFDSFASHRRTVVGP